MSVKQLLRTIKHRGIADPILEKTVYSRAYKKYMESLVWDEEIYRTRPFAEITNKYEYKAYMDCLFKKEKEIARSDPKRFKKARSEMMQLYVKERIPKEYYAHSQKPVEDKVIFMENGSSPSPSNSYISETMAKAGDYKVIHYGLGKRKASWIEYYENALEFIVDMADAKAVFISTANDLLSCFDVREETKIIQLWHGVGMFKKVGYSTMDNPKFGRGKEFREEYDQYRNYSYVTIAGEEQAWTFEDAMHISRDSGIIVPVGVSRTDLFYDSDFIKRSYSMVYNEFSQMKGKKILLYAPTFRGKVQSGRAPDALDIDKLGEALSDEYVLIIKHHGVAKKIPKIPQKWKNSFAFDFTNNKRTGIERLLAVADICITDYSSLGFEFAILERPIIFFAYDLDDYLDKRGMYYNYEDITPGPVCRTNEEMIDFIANVDSRFDKQQVIDFKNKYVDACDGHATERTIALIES